MTRFRTRRLALLAAPVAAAGCAAAGSRPPGEPVRAETGVASYYAHAFDGQRTASGAVYDERGLTAAHRTLPFGSRVRVTNLANHRSVVVTITDRGPHRHSRVIDVSHRAAEELGFVRAGTARVRLEVLSLEAAKVSPDDR